jgi:hypothetical protein
MPLCDATFISTAGPLLGRFSDGGQVAFLPNPVDHSLERGRVFERAETPSDLFFSVGVGAELRNHVGEWTTPDKLAATIKSALPDVRMALHGPLGTPLVFGPDYEAAILECGAAISMSRRNDAYLYSSDRLAHVVGNGVAVHIDRATGYGDLFDEDAFCFYSSEDELIENVARLAAEPVLRQSIARNGWRRYFELFNSSVVAAYMIDVLLGRHDKTNFEWPTLAV